MSISKVDFPPPETPVTQVNTPKRNFRRDVLQIVGARPRDLDHPVLVDPPAPSGNGDLLQADEILAGQRARIGHDLARRPLRDHLAAMDAGTRPDIDDVIRRMDRVFVMLDDDHGIADISEMNQRLEKPRIVALMQPDRGLVENIEHAGQS